MCIKQGDGNILTDKRSLSQAVVNIVSLDRIGQICGQKVKLRSSNPLLKRIGRHVNCSI